MSSVPAEAREPSKFETIVEARSLCSYTMQILSNNNTFKPRPTGNAEDDARHPPQPEVVWKMRDMVGEGDEYSTLTFEGIPFAGPCDPDAVLRKTYGDYMKLPPEDKRVSPHTFTAYYRQP